MRLLVALLLLCAWQVLQTDALRISHLRARLEPFSLSDRAEDEVSDLVRHPLQPLLEDQVDALATKHLHRSHGGLEDDETAMAQDMQMLAPTEHLLANDEDMNLDTFDWEGANAAPVTESSDLRNELDKLDAKLSSATAPKKCAKRPSDPLDERFKSIPVSSIGSSGSDRWASQEWTVDCSDSSGSVSNTAPLTTATPATPASLTTPAAVPPATTITPNSAPSAVGAAIPPPDTTAAVAAAVAPPTEPTNKITIVNNKNVMYHRDPQADANDRMDELDNHMKADSDALTAFETSDMGNLDDDSLQLASGEMDLDLEGVSSNLNTNKPAKEQPRIAFDESLPQDGEFDLSLPSLSLTEDSDGSDATFDLASLGRSSPSDAQADDLPALQDDEQELAPDMN